MRGPTHALAGACTTLAFTAFPISHHYPLLILSGVGAFAALVPDLDGSESTIENLRILGFRPLKWPGFIVDKLFKHRGFLHSLLAVAILAFILLGFFPEVPKEFVITALLGYSSHLLTDGLTPLGIPLFYPLEWRVTFLPKILCITTGSLAEGMVFVALIVLYVIFLSSAGYLILPS